MDSNVISTKELWHVAIIDIFVNENGKKLSNPEEEESLVTRRPTLQQATGCM